MTTFIKQLEVIRNRSGFIAALDQSGGSTPSALEEYGLSKNEWNNDEEMFELVHKMRTRIIQGDCFNQSKIVGAILFEDTLYRSIASQPTGDYLWYVKGIVPFLKIDEGLSTEINGVQLMKPMPKLIERLSEAKQQPIFGTKMRSVIREANRSGIESVVEQQFDLAGQIMDAGLLPIIEPEIDIHCPEKAEAEELLSQAITHKLNHLASDRRVMLKLTLPEIDNHYAPLVTHGNVLKVVALSGGYSRDEANEKLKRQHRVIASFSRALAEGLTVHQSDKEFNERLCRSIESIFDASSIKNTTCL